MSPLSKTPDWFQRLIGPIILTLAVAVPLTMKAAAIQYDVLSIDEGLIQLQIQIDKLERRGDETAATTQRYEIKQAVMDAKLDRVLIWIDRQE